MGNYLKVTPNTPKSLHTSTSSKYATLWQDMPVSISLVSNTYTDINVALMWKNVKPLLQTKFMFHYAGMFYYFLGNLRPELRSTHRSIQLIACI